VEFIVATATTRPKTLGLPFTRWSIRKLADYLAGTFRRVDTQMAPGRKIRIGRERLRQILKVHKITFQRTRTWKESTDPDFEAKLDRIEHVTTHFLDRCFAFDQFGPLSIRPHHGSGRAPTAEPTESVTSTAVTASATTSCGVSTAAAKAATTPWPPSNPSEPPAPMVHRST
jgi:hypothetical protein